MVIYIKCRSDGVINEKKKKKCKNHLIQNCFNDTQKLQAYKLGR